MNVLPIVLCFYGGLHKYKRPLLGSTWHKLEMSSFFSRNAVYLIESLISFPTNSTVQSCYDSKKLQLCFNWIILSQKDIFPKPSPTTAFFNLPDSWITNQSRLPRICLSYEYTYIYSAVTKYLPTSWFIHFLYISHSWMVQLIKQIWVLDKEFVLIFE